MNLSCIRVSTPPGPLRYYIKKMKIGIIREGKIPPDKRVPLTPAQCVEVQESFPGVKVFVQPGLVRYFHDEAYLQQGIVVQEDLSECDVLLGVKEVPARKLIPGKIYFFFSHTIKMQPYNKKLLKNILQKNIQLVDYEVLTDSKGLRIIGFGRFAGLAGAYNGLRAFGRRYNIYSLKPAYEGEGLAEMLEQVKNVKLPPVKIAVTGDGRVASGVIELLGYMNVRKISPEEYLETVNQGTPVYTQLSPQHYVKRMDGSKFNLMDFFAQPQMYENAFLPFAHKTDILMAAAYWHPAAPVLFTANDMKHDEFRIRIISDITCDIEGSIPSTKRAATIEAPFYDYNPVRENLEPPFSSAENITVQAVDNLPNELPGDASEDFGRNLIEKVFPALMGNDADGIIERATITKNGKLTPQFSYLQDFVDT